MSIQLERSLELRKIHTENGNLRCEHIYEKVFFSGIPVGDYACKKCGRSLSESAYIKLMRKNNH